MSSGTETFPGQAVSVSDGVRDWCPGPDSNGHDVLASADFKSDVVGICSCWFVLIESM